MKKYLKCPALQLMLPRPGLPLRLHFAFSCIVPGTVVSTCQKAERLDSILLACVKGYELQDNWTIRLHFHHVFVASFYRRNKDRRVNVKLFKLWQFIRGSRHACMLLRPAKMDVSVSFLRERGYPLQYAFMWQSSLIFILQWMTLLFWLLLYAWGYTVVKLLNC